MFVQSSDGGIFGQSPRIAIQHNGDWLVKSEWGTHRMGFPQTNGRTIELMFAVGPDGAVLLSHPCPVSLRRLTDNLGEIERIADFPAVAHFIVGDGLIAVLDVGDAPGVLIIHRTGMWNPMTGEV